MKKIKNIFIKVIWTCIFSYITLISLVQLPPVQRAIASFVGQLISEEIDSKVSVGKINLGLLNRFIIDDVIIFDRNKKEMIKSSRLSAKIDIFNLFNGKISLSSLQIFGFDGNFYKTSSNEPYNYQFILDKFSRNNNTSNNRNKIEINSIIIRNGQFTYRNNSLPQKKWNKFNHLRINHISAHININELTEDSLNIYVKRLSFKIHNKLDVKELSFRLELNKSKAFLKSLSIRVNNSNISIPEIFAKYDLNNGKIKDNSLSIQCKKTSCILYSDDINAIINKKELLHKIFYIKTDLYLDFGYLSSSKTIIRTKDKDFNFNGRIKTSLSKKNKINEVFIQSFYISKNLQNKICGVIEQEFKNKKTVRNYTKLVKKLDDIKFTGKIKQNRCKIDAIGKIESSNGNIAFILSQNNKNIQGILRTQNLNIGRFASNRNLGRVTSLFKIRGIKDLNTNNYNYIINGDVSLLEFNSYKYSNLTFNGTYRNNLGRLNVSIDDPNIHITASLSFKKDNRYNKLILDSKIKDINPEALKLSKLWPKTKFSSSIGCNLTWEKLSNLDGYVNLKDFTMKSPKDFFSFKSLNVKISNRNQSSLCINSDFANINIKGVYNLENIVNAFGKIIHYYLPLCPLPTLNYSTPNNKFIISGQIYDGKWLESIFSIPTSFHETCYIDARIDDLNKDININFKAPYITYNKQKYKDISLNIFNQNDSLIAIGNITNISNRQKELSSSLTAKAYADKLTSTISFKNKNKNSNKYGFEGVIDSETYFSRNTNNEKEINILVKPSKILIGDSTWNISSSRFTIKKDLLKIHRFNVLHNKQSLKVSGTVSTKNSDTLTVSMNDIDVDYFLNFINFHSVKFGGLATGKMNVSNLRKNPYISAGLQIKNFQFINGKMGILDAQVNYNPNKKQIEIDATANAGFNNKTLIKGYVSPKRNYIDLNIKAINTPTFFLNSLCSNFMRDVKIDAKGEVRLYGPLDNINLVGKLVANGSMVVNAVNTQYFIKNSVVNFNPGAISFINDTICDFKGNQAYLTGSIHHQNLSNLSYNLHIKANNLLTYNFSKNEGGNFYGTVYANGFCDIQGKDGDLNISANIAPQKDSQLVYDISTQESDSNNSFLKWNTSTTDTTKNELINQENNIVRNSDTNLNLIIHTTPLTSIKILTDNQNNDYIKLCGTGVINASYYNKGALNLYGNYTLSNGIYKITIQNLIKKDFHIDKGGTITFSGNPFDANLNLKAVYPLNIVSLSDLNIGKTFANNNIKVNCIMNISGTPLSPKIDFNIDMPNLNTDIQKMVYSIMKNDQDLNQQVLYLLAVGRFYNPRYNTNSNVKQTQTSLAMQSLLSGTISQQLNKIIGNAIDNPNWTFGANISTGDEGWNNAEYEGILSGNLLNNRLIFNGQFGYRDNPNSTTNFIGDFDLRYLLLPSGNLAIKVYNQTNDRYFTRNSLNTQGIGLIMKKDFSSIRELFPFFKKKKTRKSIRNVNNK